MRICIFQSAYPVGHPLQREDPGSLPDLFTDVHQFEHRWITKEGANEAIDRALEENFDAYFSFMWGQYEDDVAGIAAVEHLESRSPHFIGMPSRVLKETKSSFYDRARENGGPQVPGNDLSKFPLFVKPASRCASMFVNEHSKCHTTTELQQALAKLNELLESERKQLPFPIKWVDHGSFKIPSDISVSQYVDGHDHSLVVVEIGDTPFPLCPEKYCYPSSVNKDRGVYLTMDLKFHEETRLEMIPRSLNPALFDRMQETAVAAYHASNAYGTSWCNVDMRVNELTGEIIVIEVNPMPAIFLPPDAHQWEDLAVKFYWPGGHRSLINNALATLRLREQASKMDSTMQQVQGTYDNFAATYDDRLDNIPTAKAIIRDAVAEFDFDGYVLDCCCGTGLFGKLLREKYGDTLPCKLSGTDLSAQMVKQAENLGVYSSLAVGPLQQLLPTTRLDSNKSVDHIVCFFALQFFDSLDLAMILSAAFLQAQRSVTITIDEVTDAYNDSLRRLNFPHMVQVNHLPELKRFSLPHGWKRVCMRRQFGWKSPHSGDDIYTTFVRWEKIDFSYTNGVSNGVSNGISNGTTTNGASNGHVG